MEEQKLTPKQSAFTAEYLVDRNATQAAIRAGYSEKTAQRIGFENLTKPVIAKVIEQAIKIQSERTKVTADKVIAEYAKIAFADVRSFIDPGGKTKSIHDLSKDDSAAIKDFERTADGSTKIKLHDKLKSLDSLAKHLGLLQPETAEMGQVPSLQFFMQYEDGTIKNVSDKPMSEQTAGVVVNVVDASMGE